MTIENADIAQTLSAAVAPVFLISGVGVLLGSMNIRYGRVIDRARTVLHVAKTKGDGVKDADVDTELKVLYRRAQSLRTTIILASSCIFSLALCIFLIFITTILNVPLPRIITALFTLGLIFLILSLALFIRDFAVSLRALKREIRVATGRDVIGSAQKSS